MVFFRMFITFKPLSSRVVTIDVQLPVHFYGPLSVERHKKE